MSHKREFYSDRGCNPNRRSASYSDEDSNYSGQYYSIRKANQMRKYNQSQQYAQQRFHQKYTKAQIENGLKFYDKKKMKNELKQKEIMLKIKESQMIQLQKNVQGLIDEANKLRHSLVEAVLRGDKESAHIFLAALNNCVQVTEKTENLSKESSIKYLEVKKQVEKVKNQIQLWKCQ